MSGDPASPATRPALRGRRRDRDDHARPARRAQRADDPAEEELLAAFRAVARDRERPGGRADRCRPGVLRRPGPQGAARARTRRRSPSRSASATTRSSARCAGSTSRSSGRSTASPPAPGRRSPSPATSGSRPRARASCWRSGGSGWCPTAARRGSCRGSSAPAKAAELALLGEPLSAADAERFGLVRAGRAGRGAGRGGARRSPRGWPRWRRVALALTKRALAAELVGRPRGGARGRGVAPGDRRSDGRPRRGHRGVPREAAAAVHRGVARLRLTSSRGSVVGCRLTSVS